MRYPFEFWRLPDMAPRRCVKHAHPAALPGGIYQITLSSGILHYAILERPSFMPMAYRWLISNEDSMADVTDLVKYWPDNFRAVWHYKVKGLSGE